MDIRHSFAYTTTGSTDQYWYVNEPHGDFEIDALASATYFSSDKSPGACRVTTSGGAENVPAKLVLYPGRHSDPYAPPGSLYRVSGQLAHMRLQSATSECPDPNQNGPGAPYDFPLWNAGIGPGGFENIDTARRLSATGSRCEGTPVICATYRAQLVLRCVAEPLDTDGDCVRNTKESRPECSDRKNNDLDAVVDFPRDPGCVAPSDASELGTVQCDNGRDDDRDGRTDWPRDPGCSSATDGIERAQCFKDRCPVEVRVVDDRTLELADDLGRVSSAPGRLRCSEGLCNGTFKKGTVLVLRQHSRALGKFRGWRGACDGRRSTCRVKVSRPVFTDARYRSEILVGATCGLARFDWYEITMAPGFVKQGDAACSFLLGNRVAREVLSTAARAGKTLTETFGEVIARELAERYGSEFVTQQIEKQIKKRLRRAAWNYLARGIPRALLAFRTVNAITLLGRAAIVHATPLTALAVLSQIKARKACVQIDAQVKNEQLNIGWNLVYSPSALKDPKRDAALTYSTVRDRVEKTLQPDELKPYRLNLRCGESGEVVSSGSAISVFNFPQTVIG